MSKTKIICMSIAGSALMIMAGCAHRANFLPVSEANLVPGAPRTAREAMAGVSMDVRMNSWNGDPADLTSIVTPVKVTIRNEGPHAISLRYDDFMISNPGGVESSALPPFKIRGSETELQPMPIAPGFAFNNFEVYPYYGFYGPTLGVWPDDWGWNAGWYGTYYGYWQKNLPTTDMLQKAIPEGVLNVNGSVTGYLFFQRVPKTAKSLTFNARLMDARTHQQIGNIEIGFAHQVS